MTRSAYALEFFAMGGLAPLVRDVLREQREVVDTFWRESRIERARNRALHHGSSRTAPVHVGILKGALDVARRETEIERSRVVSL